MKRINDLIMNLRRAYWEWNKDWDVNVYIRYYPVKKFIEKNRIGRKPLILDAGSGPKGIAQFYRRGTVVGLDYFLENEKRASDLRPVCGSVYKLPFLDRAFDFVICIDVLEHIPGPSRSQVLQELIRVTRHSLILGIPCGKEAEERDQRVYLIDKRNNRVSRWLQEHITEGLPTEEFIDKTISSEKSMKIEKKIKNDNIALISIRDWVYEGFLRKFRRIVSFPMSAAAVISWGKCYRKYWFVTRIK